MDLTTIERHLDRLYAELAELKRYVITNLPVAKTTNDQAWQDLIEASKEVTARWQGPGAVDEIRAQREK